MKTKGMKGLGPWLVGLMAWLLCANAHAAWIDTKGTVKHIITYAHTNTVLVELSHAGADVTACSNKSTFAISNAIQAEVRGNTGQALYCFISGLKGLATSSVYTKSGTGSLKSL
ncbi:hypothetical protein Q4519_21230 [Motilimonas sp. 1_MG-2023]|uniref:hypothetical protein n=1 Tax=Motilimonas sp. 1_MG-2023 TaxID=3062672 RepID=UPI0026E3E504|nr:hypothetical protein [Motilimonas sp. 1_MG-2023]MDO6528192.1 hypothetical protein [Motilimonas sp. 1_MG-2023]